MRISRPNPYVDFVSELVNSMDEKDLVKVAEAVSKRLQEKPVIDIPGPTPRVPLIPTNRLNHTQRTVPGNAGTPNVLKDIMGLLGNDSIKPLLQLGIKALLTNLAKTNSNPNPSSNPGNSSDPNPSTGENIFKLNPVVTNVLFSLPKIMQVYQEKSREEKLLEALLPFCDRDLQRKLSSIRPYIKVYNMIQLVPGILPQLKFN